MSIRLRSNLPEIAYALCARYPHFPFQQNPEAFVDCEVSVESVHGLRRWVRPTVRFLADGIDPFGPLPRPLAFPHLEWGVNWVLANILNQHLLLHSGTVQISDQGVLMVAQPGSGKSTLTAALSLRGARVLSDEFGVLSLREHRLLAVAKPIALKNESIDMIRHWEPKASIGPTFHKTHKGDVAHLGMTVTSLAQRDLPCYPGLIVFPKWRKDAEFSMLSVRPAKAFSMLALNSFNYQLLGPDAFVAVDRLVKVVSAFASSTPISTMQFPG